MIFGQPFETHRPPVPRPAGDAGKLCPMSPTSRSRKPKKRNKSAGRPGPVAPVGPCDCPACAGQDIDPSEMIDAMLADVRAVAEDLDPLGAEYLAAMFVAMCELTGEDYEDALAEGFVPEFEARADTAALIMLRALGSICLGRAGKAASAAAERLSGAGISLPDWAGEIGEPVTAGDCWRLADPDGTGAMLVGSFQRAGSAHALMVSVDHHNCGAATTIMLLDADGLPDALELIKQAGVAVDQERVDPAELRWQVESAMDARAVHDEEEGELPFEEDDLPDYYPLAVLLRARLRALPESGKPKPAHRGVIMPPPWTPHRRRAAAKSPETKRGTGPAPVYQLKVVLQGSKPPIWRRLEVPADTNLARLHEIIQVAFGWEDCHLHAFDTPYGDFGIPDPELGHEPADSVTLEQVLPGARSKITYTYDFGDDWRHEIVVEKVLDPEETVTYPRCTGGRRAGPPEDCGGIWAYSDLLDVLADPAHPEHGERLEWLGLERPTEFDPADFDAAAVTRALADLP